jgi:hypothetical protein
MNTLPVEPQKRVSESVEHARKGHFQTLEWCLAQFAQVHDRDMFVTECLYHCGASRHFGIALKIAEHLTDPDLRRRTTHLIEERVHILIDASIVWDCAE